jgi:hypothetical protein
LTWSYPVQTVPPRTTLAQLDEALDHTRAERVQRLSEEPPAHLVGAFGPAPSTPAGRAVWCHHALGIEAALDRHDGADPSWQGWSQQTLLARKDIAVADRFLDVVPIPPDPDPATWAETAADAAEVREELHRQIAVRSAVDSATLGPSVGSGSHLERGPSSPSLEL